MFSTLNTFAISPKQTCCYLRFVSMMHQLHLLRRPNNTLTAYN